MICKHILLTFLNKPELIFCSQFNDFKYRYISLTIPLDSHLLNGQIVLFLTIQFSISHLLALTLKCQTILFDNSI